VSGLTAKLIWDRRSQSTLPRPQGEDFYYLLRRVVAATSRRRRMQREENAASRFRKLSHTILNT